MAEKKGLDINAEKEIDKLLCKDQIVSFQLSGYLKKLDLYARKLYIEKNSVIGIDSVVIPEVKRDTEYLPQIEAADLLSFLVLETSYCTNKQFKAFRNLSAYTQAFLLFPFNNSQMAVTVEYYQLHLQHVVFIISLQKQCSLVVIKCGNIC